MGKTSIEWTDYSWPVVNGCRRVSAGCEHCYAERLTATRLSQQPKYKGLAVMKAPPPRVLRTDRANGGVNLRVHQLPGRPRWTGESRLWVPHLDMPRKLRKPSRIFVADMGDLFYERVTDQEIAAVWAVMRECPQHTFQVLTKRPERARAWLERCGEPASATGYITHDGDEPPAYGGKGMVVGTTDRWPLPNVWLGTSVENQQTYDARVPHLLATPAAVRFLSAEPLLGPVKLADRDLGCVGHLAATFGNPLVNWVIVGGESGPGARSMDLAWARQLVQACEAAGVACFVKQLGAWPLLEEGEVLELDHRKGADPAEWPEDLRVRQWPVYATERQAVSSASVREEKEEVPPGGGHKSEARTVG